MCSEPLRWPWPGDWRIEISKFRNHSCSSANVCEGAADSLASFLGIGRGKISANPEQLDDPKAEMVNLARYSKRLAIRKGMAPRQGSGRSVGPAYASRLIEYVQTFWQPKTASRQSDNLKRALACLGGMSEKVA